MKKVKLLGLLLAITLVACGSKEEKMELKKEAFTFELESEIIFNKKDILKTEDKKVLDETKLSITIDEEIAVENEIVVEEDGNGSVLSISNLPVGEYKGVVEYEKEKAEFKVLVEDTTAPEFKDFKEKVEIELNSTEDISAKFVIDDFSSTKITVDMKNVDLTKVGEYKTTVTAEDEYKNKTEKDIVIVVKEKIADAEKEDAKASETSEAGSNATSGSTGGAPNTNGNGGTSGGNGNGGGGSSAPAPNTPKPTQPAEAIVQLNPTPLGGHIFETQDEAVTWANSLMNDKSNYDPITLHHKHALNYGYTTITNWVTGTIRYGYASTGEIVYYKHTIVFTFQ